MYSRDLFIQCSLSGQKICENLQEVLRQFGKPAQVGTSTEQLNTYYIVQPEKLLLVVQPIEKSKQQKIWSENFSTHVRFQPYNLPDLMDQEQLLEKFPEEFSQKLQMAYPDWKLKLQPLSLKE